MKFILKLFGWNNLFRRYKIESALFKDWIIKGSNNEEFDFFENISYTIGEEKYHLIGFHLVKKKGFLEFQKILGKIENKIPNPKIQSYSSLDFILPIDGWNTFSVDKISERKSLCPAIGWPYRNFRKHKHSYFTIDMVSSILQTNEAVVSPSNTQTLRFDENFSTKINLGIFNFLIYSRKTATFKIEMIAEGNENNTLKSNDKSMSTMENLNSVTPPYVVGMPCPSHCPKRNGG